MNTTTSCTTAAGGYATAAAATAAASAAAATAAAAAAADLPPFDFKTRSSIKAIVNRFSDSCLLFFIVSFSCFRVS